MTVEILPQFFTLKVECRHVRLLINHAGGKDALPNYSDCTVAMPDIGIAPQQLRPILRPDLQKPCFSRKIITLGAMKTRPARLSNNRQTKNKQRQKSQIKH
ncbi:MAG: hypothetical protein JW837_12280 [Sedimentisphaerales bacterium]|nr:hypothetical protein [Sedimentisphaerales bacterium]